MGAQPEPTRPPAQNVDPHDPLVRAAEDSRVIASFMRAVVPTLDVPLTVEVEVARSAEEPRPRQAGGGTAAAQATPAAKEPFIWLMRYSLRRVKVFSKLAPSGVDVVALLAHPPTARSAVVVSDVRAAVRDQLIAWGARPDAAVVIDRIVDERGRSLVDGERADRAVAARLVSSGKLETAFRDVARLRRLMAVDMDPEQVARRVRDIEFAPTEPGTHVAGFEVARHHSDLIRLLVHSVVAGATVEATIDLSREVGDQLDRRVFPARYGVRKVYPVYSATTTDRNGKQTTSTTVGDLPFMALLIVDPDGKARILNDLRDHPGPKGEIPHHVVRLVNDRPPERRLQEIHPATLGDRWLAGWLTDGGDLVLALVQAVRPDLAAISARHSQTTAGDLA